MYRTEAEAEEPELRPKDNLKAFLSVHYRGLICIFVPIICIGVLLPFPPEPYQWTIYCLLVMVVFWVTECIPLPVTSLLPLVIFPITGVMGAVEACQHFSNDYVYMFIACCILAASVEQSGLHKRIAFIAIRFIGYSHVKLLVTMVAVTSFISMWIPKTAATAMMVPIIFAVLKVFEDQKFIKIYETTEDGDKIASDITTCYFCTANFSAAIGSIGTKIELYTIINAHVLTMNRFPRSPEYLTFSLYCKFSIPYMIVLDAFMILYILVVYVGFLRPNSSAAKRAKIPLERLKAAEATANRDYEALGNFTFWEFMAILLYSGAIVLLFSRSPAVFFGWGDAISSYYRITDYRYIVDTVPLALITMLMLLLPSNLSFFDNCTAKFHEDLPKQRVTSVVNWKILMAELPFSFVFLLGGASVFARAARYKGLVQKIGEFFRGLKSLPSIVLLLLSIIAVFVYTNVVADVEVQEHFFPVLMQLALAIPANPRLYILIDALCPSYCFMLPAGSIGSLIVQGYAKIPTSKMVKAGFGPTITTIIITWLAVSLYAPTIWPDLNIAKPAWIK